MPPYSRRGGRGREGETKNCGLIAYRGVYGLVPIEVAVLVEAVVCLAEGHTGKEVCHQAEVNGAEAAEEGRIPRLSALG